MFLSDIEGLLSWAAGSSSGGASAVDPVFGDILTDTVADAFVTTSVNDLFVDILVLG